MRSGWLFAASSLVLAACGGPATFEEVADVQHASAQGPNLNIVARQQLVTEGLAMEQFAMLVRGLAEGLQDELPGPGPSTQHVQIQLGHVAGEGTLDFGTVRFPLTALKSADLDHMIGTQILELADDVSPSAGFDLAIEYCADPQNFDLNPRWCSQVAEEVGPASE